MITKDPEWAANEISLTSDFNRLANKHTNHYLLTRDAATMLIMGFTGAKAFVWKRRYVEAFNAMEAEIHRRAEVNVPPAPEPKAGDERVASALRLTRETLEEMSSPGPLSAQGKRKVGYLYSQ